MFPIGINCKQLIMTHMKLTDREIAILNKNGRNNKENV